MKKFFSLWIFISSILSQAQNFKGEIFLKDTSSLYLNPIYVTNITTQKTVLSDGSGMFNIAAQPGDLIRFTSIVTERKDIIMNAALLNSPKTIIELRVAYIEIPEIVLQKFRPTGNLKNDVLALKTNNKKYELKRAVGLPEPRGDGTPPHMPVAAFTGGGLTFSIESIYDLISGEKKKKERLFQYEKMTRTLTDIKNYFGKDYFLKLKIPENLIDNFLQFVYSSDPSVFEAEKQNFEAVQFYFDKYLPIYQKRLRNSHLIELVK